MRFDELFNFAVERRAILLETTLDPTALGPGETIFDRLQACTPHLTGSINPAVIPVAVNLALTAGSGQSYVKKTELLGVKREIALVNLLCWFFELIGGKSAIEKDNARALVVDPNTSRDYGKSTVLKPAAKWWDLFTANVGARTGGFKVSLETASKKPDVATFLKYAEEEDVLNYNLAQKYNEADDVSVILKQLEEQTIVKATALAIAAHFKNMNSKDPISEYKPLVNILYTHPEKLMFFTNPNVFANLTSHDKDTDFKPIGQLSPFSSITNGFIDTFTADDPQVSHVRGVIEDISEQLLIFTKEIIEKLTPQSNAVPVVGASQMSVNVPANKSAEQARLDMTVVKNVYLALLKGELKEIPKNIHTAGSTTLTGGASSIPESFAQYLIKEAPLGLPSSSGSGALTVRPRDGLGRFTRNYNNVQDATEVSVEDVPAPLALNDPNKTTKEPEKLPNIIHTLKDYITADNNLRLPSQTSAKVHRSLVQLCSNQVVGLGLGMKALQNAAKTLGSFGSDISSALAGI